MSTVSTVQSSTPETKPRVTKGSIWINDTENILFFNIPKENGEVLYDGQQIGARAIQIAISKSTGEFYQLDNSSYVPGNGRLTQIYPAPPQDVNKEVLEALRSLVLFDRNDPDFMAGLAEDSAALEENPSTPVWRDRLLEKAERALANAAVQA